MLLYRSVPTFLPMFHTYITENPSVTVSISVKKLTSQHIYYKKTGKPFHDQIHITSPHGIGFFCPSILT